MNKNWFALGCGGLLVAAIALAVIVGGWLMAVNNSLVASQEQMKAAWAQVETVLQRRYDLIPNLVATVKGYAQHEKELFENVARLRSQWSAAQTVPDKAKAAVAAIHNEIAQRNRWKVTVNGFFPLYFEGAVVAGGIDCSSKKYSNVGSLCSNR